MSSLFLRHGGNTERSRSGRRIRRKLKKAREENAEEERRKYEEKGWEGWEGHGWSKVDWSNPYEYERFARCDAPWPYRALTRE